jgi:hypothetical protein
MRRFLATLALVLSVPFLGYAALAAILLALHANKAPARSLMINQLREVEPYRLVIAGMALVIGLVLLTLGRALGKSTDPTD